MTIKKVALITGITYHWGDVAGQGYFHGFAGMLLFLNALLLIIGFDTALHISELYRQRRHPIAASA